MLAKKEYITSKPYKIQNGDSLSIIARDNNTSVSAILALNKLTNTNIRAGREILIPIDTEKPIKDLRSYHIVKRGDSLSKIAKDNNTSIKNIMHINGLKNHNIVIGNKLYI